MCCERLRQLRRSRKSEACLQFLLSVWKLKSPRSRTEGEWADSWVTRSVKSERKDGFGLGGR